MKHSISSFFIVMLLWLTGCSDPQMKCIEADDFGYPKFKVFADREELDVINYRDAPDREKDRDDMVASWKYSGYISTGSRSLIITTETVEGSDSWTSWFEGRSEFMGDNKDKECDCEKTCPNKLKAKDAPCWFKYGCGLYLLIAPVQDENRTKLVRGMPDLKKLDTAEDPPSPPFTVQHVGYRGKEFYELASPPRGRLYFKIMDSYYNDNAGYYIVRMKDGAIDPDIGPALTMFNFIKGIADASTVSVYNDLVHDSTWKKSLIALLVLYVITSSVVFMLGMSKEPITELISRLWKCALIAILISDSSWDFFNRYFFSFFTNGSLTLIAEFMTAGAGFVVGSKYITNLNYDPLYPADFFDQIFHYMLSQETLHKVLAVLFSSTWGIVFVFGLVVAILIWVLAIVKSIIAYCLAYFALSLLIMVFPVFICFSLFKITQQVFNSYLRTLITYALQPVLLFALMGMMTAIVFFYMHRTMGYRVCWQSWWDLQISLSDIVNALTGISIPSLGLFLPIYNFKYFLFDKGAADRINKYGSFDCDHSSESVLKQVGKEYPYFDPTDPKDCQQIKDMMGGEYIGIFEVLVFVFVAYLIFKFGNQIVEVTKSITAQVSAQDLGKAAGDFMKGAGDSAGSGANPFASSERDQDSQNSGSKNSGSSNNNNKNKNAKGGAGAKNKGKVRSIPGGGNSSKG
ncbi:MAG: type IV secretion system protein [Alphaproteobacteria bacterium]|nr:type IV secretion system protein [Alphaproteobacteria bacterium]